jgi:2'-5' RNA ligase
MLRDHWWWRPGWRVGTRFFGWHVTVDGQIGLHRLVDSYQAALASIDGLDPIPRQWLHLTLQGVGFVQDVPLERLSAMVKRTQARLAGVGPVVVQFHKSVIRPEGIALPPTPVEPVQDIRAVVRAAIADVAGPDGVPEAADGYQPHVSVAYVNRDMPATDVLRAIQGIDADPVDVVIAAVSLIEMHRDRRMNEWRTIADVRIGRP